MLHTQLWGVWAAESPQLQGPLGPASVLEARSHFIPMSLGQQVSKAVIQGPESVRHRPRQDSSDEKSPHQSSLLGGQRPCQAYSRVCWVPSPIPASALSSPRCNSGSASWRTQLAALPDNKGIDGSGQNPIESLHWRKCHSLHGKYYFSMLENEQ